MQVETGLVEVIVIVIALIIWAYKSSGPGRED